MASDKTKIPTAKNYYVEQRKDLEEIAVLLNVAPRTLRDWAKKGKWKETRDAKINGTQQQIDNIKKVISNLTEQTLSLHEQRLEAVLIQDKKAIAALDLQAVGIADQVSKWKSTLDALDKKGKVSLEVYLYVMDEIFGQMQKYDNKLFLSTIAFQQREVERISNHIG